LLFQGEVIVNEEVSLGALDYVLNLTLDVLNWRVLVVVLRLLALFVWLLTLFDVNRDFSTV